MTSKKLPVVKKKDLCSWVFDEAEEGKLDCNNIGATGVKNGELSTLPHQQVPLFCGSMSNALTSHREAEKGGRKKDPPCFYKRQRHSKAEKFFGWILPNTLETSMSHCIHFNRFIVCGTGYHDRMSLAGKGSIVDEPTSYRTASLKPLQADRVDEK
jgi:hypothetical protein